MANPTSPETLEKINNFLDSSEQLMSNLYGRWQDEKEHEDINDYKAPIEKNLPSGFVITKMNKRPFGFNFTVGTNAEYQLFMNRTQMGWKRLK